MNLVLTRSDLFELTGYKQAAALKKWLTTNGLPYYMGADGWPRVLKQSLENRPKTLTRSTPDVSALLEMQRNGKASKKQARPA
jgi:hypothetical protein